MAKFSLFVATLALVAFAGTTASAACGHLKTAQQTSVQTAEQPQQTTKPTTTKTEDDAQ